MARNTKSLHQFGKTEVKKILKKEFQPLFSSFFSQSGYMMCTQEQLYEKKQAVIRNTLTTHLRQSGCHCQGRLC